MQWELLIPHLRSTYGETRVRDVHSDAAWHALLVFDGFTDLILHITVDKPTQPSTSASLAIEVLTATRVAVLSQAHRQAIGGFVNCACAWLYAEMQ